MRHRNDDTPSLRARRRPPQGRRGVALLDVLVTITIIGIVVAAIIPSLTPNEHLRLITAAGALASDIEYAQASTITEPADPIVVMFREEGDGWWLAFASEPDNPILRPNSADQEWVSIMGQGLFSDLVGVTIRPDADLNDRLEFDDFGRIDLAEDPVIGITNLSGSILLRVKASTGTVEIVSPDEVD